MHSEQFYDTEGLKVTAGGDWNELDALIRHPESGAVMFVGSQVTTPAVPVELISSDSCCI